MKSKILLLLYSLSIMFVWGICFLNGGGFTSEISVLLGLGFTMYSLYVVKSSRIFVETKHGVLFVLIGPMVYLVSAVVFFAASHISFFLTSPILFAFVVFSLTLYIKEFSMKTHGVAILFVCYMYAYSVFPTFEIIGEQLAEKKQLTELLQE